MIEGKCGMDEIRVITSGLRFPEGPVAMADGSVVLTEIAGGTITKVSPDGEVSIIANTGGGPNGLAIGPDHAFYVCNNGGFEYGKGHFLAIGPAKDYAGGSIQRIDPMTGKVSLLYAKCGENRLSAPNDIVFDEYGGFYFSDTGKKYPRNRDHGGVYYALPDGSYIVTVAYPAGTPNGVGLAPDGKTLYVAETDTSRLWAYDILEPGVIRKEPFPSPYGGHLVCGLSGYQRFDSLAVDANGNICVATLITGHVTVISPSGQVLRQVKMPDIYPTNICFGGTGLRKAYVTLAGTGQLVTMGWPQPGLQLNFAA
jgi:gluconolactonase